MRGTLTLVTALLAGPGLAGTAAAQVINVDLGQGAGVPAESYGGAGYPGVWNAIDDAGAAGATLVDVVGAPAAVLSILDAGGTGPTAPDGPADDDAALLGDAVWAAPGLTARLEVAGLPNGRYEVFAYGWLPDGTTITSAPGGADLGAAPLPVTGGPWPGALQAGVTHTHLLVDVAGGVLVLEVWSPGEAPAAVNAIQIARVSSLPADLDADGIVGTSDLLILLGAWGPTEGGHGCDGIQHVALPYCAADIDRDGTVGTLDLLALLAAWTPPTPS